ncbi:MAG: glycerol-3-phosphate responsive antiterminator [Clostridia bacterium]|nr:glycerol-3-phosphate responsive antiterminator [Clostridia bacterium]
MLDYENYPVIAAVKSRDDLEHAIRSEVQAIFLLSSNIIDIEALSSLAHSCGKILFIHMDFVDGLSKDTAGVRYLSTKGIDGIISTRSNIISAAHDAGIFCIQRFFMIDSRSVDTALETLKQSKADMIEIMPALAYKSITKIKNNIQIPIIAGGLIESRDEVYKALGAGASMISTGKTELWND